MLALPEPIRGISEGIDPEKLQTHERAGASQADYIDLMVNSSYTYSVLGMAFYTFAIGGLAFYLPKFLIVAKGIEQVRATSILGAITLFAAIGGMSVGGWLADRLSKSNPRALFIVPGVAMLAAIPFVLLAIYAKGTPAVFAGVFFAEVFMFINTGPCNAVIANVVMPNLRSAAYAVALLAVHVLGDIWSPPLMGWVSDTFGKRDAMATVFGRMFALVGAVPSVQAARPPENLTAGMLVVVPALLLSGCVLLAGARHLPREMALMLAKLKASPRHASTAGLAASSR
jgi:MFS family permease